ncbi:MAG: hypothetical protein SOR31_01165 [Parvimonas sp.]|nr:hypothetical protein [Parvimonas sp.]MDY3050223.1 hypothetical protein [Parvimonas sp.]
MKNRIKKYSELLDLSQYRLGKNIGISDCDCVIVEKIYLLCSKNRGEIL